MNFQWRMKSRTGGPTVHDRSTAPCRHGSPVAVRAASCGFADLWLRGGFPRAFTAKTLGSSMRWRHDLISTYLERDLPQLGIRVPGTTLRRFWSMLAHVHGQILNGAELGRSMAVGGTSVVKLYGIAEI